MFNIHRTVLQEARTQSLAEFKDSNDMSKLLDDPNNYLKDGAPLIKCLPGSESANSLLYDGMYSMPKADYLKTRDTSDVTNPTLSDVTDFFNNMTDSIVDIKQAGNYQECVEMLNSIHSDMGTDFYGALLIDGKTILNPFHPVTAMLMSDKNKQSDLHSRTYRIAIYGYENKTEYDRWHKHFKSDYADADHIESQLNNLVLMSSHQIHTKLDVVSTSSNGTEEVKIKYKLSKHPQEDPDYEFYLSAHQLLTKGVVMPWYASSFVKMNGNTKGRHISPMLTCNINGISYSPTEKPNFSAVCTGNLLNASLVGLRSLNHANLKSPFSTAIVGDGSLVYAQKAIIKSLEIYQTAEILSGEINHEAHHKPITEEKNTESK